MKEEVWLVNLDLGSDDWNYCAEFNSRERAIECGKVLAKEKGMNKFEIGKQNLVGIPTIDADGILEELIEQVYNESGGWAEQYEDEISSITREQFKELEDALNDVIFYWHKKHNIEPNCFTISDFEVIKLN